MRFKDITEDGYYYVVGLPGGDLVAHVLMLRGCDGKMRPTSDVEDRVAEYVRIPSSNELQKLAALQKAVEDYFDVVSLPCTCHDYGPCGRCPQCDSNGIVPRRRQVLREAFKALSGSEKGSSE